MRAQDRDDDVTDVLPPRAPSPPSPNPFVDAPRLTAAEKGKARAVASSYRAEDQNDEPQVDPQDDDLNEAMHEQDHLVALRMQEEQDLEDARAISQAEKAKERQKQRTGGQEKDRTNCVDNERGNLDHIHSIAQATSAQPHNIPNLGINRPVRPSDQIVPTSILNSIKCPKASV